VGRPLWRVDGSVIYSYNCFWALPEQLLSGPSPVELTIIFYCQCFTETPGPRSYVPQEQGGLVIPPGTVFPFRLLLRLAGLQWRYSNPPSHGKGIVTLFYYCNTSPRSGGRSVGIVRSRTQTMELKSYDLLSSQWFYPHILRGMRNMVASLKQMYNRSRQKNGSFFIVSVAILHTD
jgi:hypothetical protein